jgi:hypothetical protein
MPGTPLALLGIGNNGLNIKIVLRGELLAHAAHFFKYIFFHKVDFPINSSGVQITGLRTP